MPFIHDCSQTKGQAEPASAYLSPVARDYPNRALRGFFMRPVGPVRRPGAVQRNLYGRPGERQLSPGRVGRSVRPIFWGGGVIIAVTV